MRVPLRIKPLPDESLLGFALRLAERNGHRTPLWLLRRAGLHLREAEVFSYGKVDIGAFEDLAGVDSHDLHPMSYATSADGMRQFRGLWLAPDHFSLKPRRACPGCLSEHPYHRAAWDLAAITICPIHSVGLISACPSCGRKLGWRHVPFTRCRCGAAITGSPPIHVSSGDLMGTKMVYRIVGLEHGHVPDLLAQLGADASIRLMVALGWFLHFPQGRPRLQHLPRCQSAAALLTDGYQACAGWPESFHAYLDRLRSQSRQRVGRYGVVKEIGAFVDWLLKIAPRPVKEVLMPQVRAYVGTLERFTTRCLPLKPGAEAKFVSVAEAARILNRDPEKVRRVFLKWQIASVPFGSGKGAPMMVPTDTVAAVATEVRQLICLKDLPKALGCSRKDTLAILRAGHLQQASGGLALDLLGRRAWRMDNIEAFVARFIRVATGTADQATISLPDAFRWLRRGGMTVGEVVTALLDGKLDVTCADPSAPGLRQVLLDAEVVSARSKQVRRREDGFSIEEAAGRLGLKRQVAYELVEAGILKSSTPGRKRGKRIAVRDIEGFRSKFVLASHLGLDSGRSKGWAADRLIKMGACPVSGPSVDGRRQYVFRRSDVEALLPMLTTSP